VNPNTPPAFSSALANQSFSYTATAYSYTLPSIIDPDGPNTGTFTLGTVPSFISKTSATVIRIVPTSAVYIGTKNPMEKLVSLTISDGVNSVLYSFYVLIQFSN
jgi:hypothetical protein